MTFHFLLRPSFPVRDAALSVLLSMPLALVTAVATGLVTAPAQAQTAPAAARAQVPSDAPPAPLEKLEEGRRPGSTVRPSTPPTVITDTRDSAGRVTETQVKTGSTTYYVRPNSQVGNAAAGDLQSSRNRAAQFKIKEFDLGRKTVPEHEEVPVPQVLQPAPAKN